MVRLLIFQHWGEKKCTVSTDIGAKSDDIERKQSHTIERKKKIRKGWGRMSGGTSMVRCSSIGVGITDGPGYRAR